MHKAISNFVFWAAFWVLMSAVAFSQDSTPTDAFGRKFFDDLRTVFGRLERSDLDRAFREAKAPQCSELVGQTAEWKHVAFINDDRSLAAWHFDSIEDVKKDPSKYVFSGNCRSETDALRVATSLPVQEHLKDSLVVLRDNNPVKAAFDRRSQAYVFSLPYLYVDRKSGLDTVYTLLPPMLSSKPAKDVEEELRCKALSDPELTYRFLLCRTRLLQQLGGRASANQIRAISDLPGGAAYSILSDGREAVSSVKLTFADPIEEPSNNASGRWETPPPNVSLADLARQELRLTFNPASWNPQSSGAQFLANGAASDVASSSKTGFHDYCAWFPASKSFSMEDIPAVVTFHAPELNRLSADFDLNSGARRPGTLICYFDQVDSPAQINVSRWRTAVGNLIILTSRSH
jgi:hypothetical protein